MHLTATSQQPSNSDRGDRVTADQANDADVELMRQDLRAKRKQVIAANVPLTKAEATEFWPVYRYIAEARKINDRRYALVKDYAMNYDTMTDDQADTFIKGWVTLDRDDTDLRLQYIPEFQKVISPQENGFVLSSRSKSRHDDQPPTRRTGSTCEAVTILKIHTRLS
jgi:hypothetical protein